MEITQITKTILNNRGITGEGEIEEFLSPKPQRAHDPLSMKGIKEATERILSAVEKGEKICVYGDYDCDGVTSVFLLKTIFGRLTDKENISHYIPSRFEEGYGLKISAIDKIAEWGVSLLITVDCGITSAAEVEHAESLGIDVIITDHHNVGDKVPGCIVIDPKQEDCPYPFEGLCGCGVAYKLSQALQRATGFDRSLLLSMLDIVGIATIGDVVPLVDENRTLAKYGLYEIRRGRRKNLRTLLAMMQRQYDTLDSYGVSFGIVPHINAAGRMASAEDALSLLESGSEDEVKAISEKLIGYNSERRREQDRAFERCLVNMEVQCPDSLFPIIRDDEAHEGIVGIVAGKLSDKLARPVIVLTEKDGSLKGSGRSTDEINIYDLVATQKDILERFGGHAAACGLSLSGGDKLDELRAGLEGEMKKLAADNPGILDRKVHFDMEIEPGDVTLKLAEELESMEPFGNANEKPKFMFRDVEIRNVFFMGNENQHVRFGIHKDGRSAGAVLFFDADEYLDMLVEGKMCDIAGSVTINEFRGSRKAQINVDVILEREKK